MYVYICTDDADYSLEPYLLTPYRSAEVRSPEAIFNSKHAIARNIVQRMIGVLKNRFHCLLRARQLHYKVKKSKEKKSKAKKIVYVCAALHNVCFEYRIFDNNPEYLLNYEASQIKEQIRNSFL